VHVGANANGPGARFTKGGAENAGREIHGPLQGMKLQDTKLQDRKLQDMKMQDMNMTDQK